MLKLIILEAPMLHPEVVLPGEFVLKGERETGLIFIGRHFSNDIVIADASLSRFHLELEVQDDKLTVYNLGRQNLTFVNSKLLSPYVKTTVNPGDTIQLGKVVLKVETLSFYPSNEPKTVTISSLNTTNFVDDQNPARIPTGNQEVLPLASEFNAEFQSNLLPTTAVVPDPSVDNSPSILSDLPKLWLSQLKLGNLITWLPWFYLSMIALAEYLTAAINVQLGLLLHAVLLVSLLLHGVIGPKDSERKFALSLCVAPLIRLLSISLPLLSFPQLYWYPLVAIPLLIATWIITRQLGLKRQELGLQLGNPFLQIMLLGGGLGLGATEYLILQPQPVVNSFSWQSIILPSLILVIFTGFNEELIFRGLLQATSTPVIGKWGLLYVSLLFAALHIGYLSLLDLLFVFAVGFIFAYIVQWGGSILGVTLVHGLTNVTLFIIMPFMSLGPSPVDLPLEIVILTGTVVSIISTVMLAFNSFRKGSNKRIVGS